VSAPRVSIVVPTRNGVGTLPALLDSIATQRVDLSIEVIAVDSASTDGTVALLRGRVDQLISIPATAFDHGLTRNRAIEEARGELIVLVVQDALPASDAWLAALTAPMLADATLAGTFAKQRPRPDASPIIRHYLEQWAASSSASRATEVKSRAELEAMDPREQFDYCAFDNVCSCIRRSVWQQYPFRSTPIGEDLEWAREVLMAGYRIVYVPEAEVIHSHDRPARYEFARTYALHRRLYQLFRLRTIPTLLALITAITSSLALHLRCQKSSSAQAGSYGRAIALAFAWPLGQYLGAMSAVRGWRPMRSRMV
jgi:glycosyltransferase involved in cell wall biosynthesis